MDYKIALELAKSLIAGCEKFIFIVGSLKRKSIVINDIDLVVDKSKINKKDMHTSLFYDIFNDWLKENATLIKDGEKYKSFKYRNINIDIWYGSDKYETKFLRWMRTMDKGHNIYYRKLAQEKGLTLSDRGLQNQKNQYYDFNTKADLIRFLKKNNV